MHSEVAFVGIHPFERTEETDYLYWVRDRKYLHDRTCSHILRLLGPQQVFYLRSFPCFRIVCMLWFALYHSAHIKITRWQVWGETLLIIYIKSLIWFWAVLLLLYDMINGKNRMLLFEPEQTVPQKPLLGTKHGTNFCIEGTYLCQNISSPF